MESGFFHYLYLSIVFYNYKLVNSMTLSTAA